MKNYKVLFSPETDKDLLDIYLYVAKEDSPNKAEALYDKLAERCLSLEHLSERGHIASEPGILSDNSYREIHFKSYRIIYKVEGDTVRVFGVLDSRRDLKHLLMQRLIHSK